MPTLASSDLHVTPVIPISPLKVPHMATSPVPLCHPAAVSSHAEAAPVPVSRVHPRRAVGCQTGHSKGGASGAERNRLDRELRSREDLLKLDRL